MLMKKLRKATREMDDQLCDAITLIHNLVNANGKRTEEEITLAAEAGDPLCELHTIICDMTDVLDIISEVAEKLSGKPVLCAWGDALNAPSRSPKEVTV